MGITQRTIYVGVGGTGLKIGEHLERALRREICGVDGDNLKRVGGPFTTMESFELPSFFQSIYADFASGELVSLRSRLHQSPRIVDRTASFATNLIPAVASSSAASKYLRQNQDNTTRSWLPADDGGEPQIAPLSSGAGQFPTVGRVALFHSLATSGFQSVLGNQLSTAISRISGSLGLLTAIASGNATDQVVVYVGFSVSGGTGCGIAYDVLHLLGAELEASFGANFRLIPIVVMPSAFDMLDDGKQIAAKLNAAKALADLQRLADHQLTGADQDSFTINYPNMKSIHLGSATIPGIFVFEKSVGITQSDLFKAIAENVLSQISSTNGDDAGNGNVQSWVETAVNHVPKRREPHGSGVGLQPFIPSMSVSLSIPIEVVSNLLALRLIEDGIQDLTGGANVATEDNRQFIELFLNQSGPELAAVIKGRKPENANFQLAAGSGKSHVDKATAAYGIQAKNIAMTIPAFAKSQLAGALAPSWSTGVEAVVTSSGASGLRVIRVVNGDGAVQEQHSKGGALKVIEELTGNAPKTPPTAFKSGAFPVKPSTSDKKVQDWKVSIDKWLDDEVIQAWRTAWKAQSGSWKPSLEKLRMQVNRVKSRMEVLGGEAAGDYGQLVSALGQPTTCVAEFLPFDSPNIPAAVDHMSVQLRTRLAQGLGLNAPTAGQLFDTIVATTGDGWRSLWSGYLESDNVEDFVLRLRKIITQAVREALVDVDGVGGSILPTLGELLQRASVGDTSSVIQSLNAALSGLMPTGVFPAKKGGDPIILVSYPGLQDAGVETYLKKILAMSAQLVDLAPSLADSGGHGGNVTFTPTGTQGESLTVNVSIVGQGLLDIDESLDCQRIWRSALNNTLVGPVDGAGTYLAWRQRLSPNELGRLTSTTDRIRILQAMIGGLWRGNVVPKFDVPGDLRTPTAVEWRQPNLDSQSIGGPDLVLPLQALEGLSTWPAVFGAWESDVLSSEPVFYDTMTRLLSSTFPQGWFAGNVEAPGAALEYLLTESRTELEKIESLETHYGDSLPSGIRRELEVHRHFWKELVNAAINNTVDAGGKFKTYNEAYKWITGPKL